MVEMLASSWSRRDARARGIWGDYPVARDLLVGNYIKDTSL
jgi:hypothetical protein